MPNANVNSPQNGPYTTIYYDRSGRVVNQSTGFTRANEYTLVRSSVSTPNFRSKRPKWSLPMNPFSSYRVERHCPRGTFTVLALDPYLNQNKTVYSGCLDGISVTDIRQDRTIVQSEQVSVDNIARNKLLLKVKNQKINLAQAFAERRMTAQTIANTATRIANCMVDLKRGNIALAADALGIRVSKRANARYKREFRKHQPKAVANGWLELQYGWRPLLNDIFGAAELLALSNLDKLIRGRVSALHTVQRSFLFTSLDGNVPRTELTTVEYTRKYVCYFSARNELLSGLASMGITNPALIAWELLPYSFVADWFIPIGNWISTFDATLGLNFEKGSVTTFRKTLQNQMWTAVDIRDPYQSKSGYAQAKCTYVSVDRTTLTSFPGNALPEFKNPVSIEHAANAIALLVQLFKK